MDAVSEFANTLPPVLLRWLASHAGFPIRRLPVKAELLLCLAAAAEKENSEEADPGGFGLQRKDPAQQSALRAHAMRRSRVHFKCDNSAKV